MKPKKESKNKKNKAFETFPLANDDKRDPATNLTYPSVGNVKSAKDWVDFNKK